MPTTIVTFHRHDLANVIVPFTRLYDCGTQSCKKQLTRLGVTWEDGHKRFGTYVSGNGATWQVTVTAGPPPRKVVLTPDFLDF